MKKLISPAAMKAMENRYSIETGTPSIDLMERAAQALCDGLLRRFGRNRKIYFACGPGGNGRDGYACARLYAQAGGECAVLAAAVPESPDCIENARRARQAGIPEYTLENLPGSPEIWVDALYGTGLSRTPEGVAADLIRRMNADYNNGAILVAADIPSGLNGVTGSAWSPCVHADITFTFQLAKPCHFMGDGLDFCGEIEILDIGIPSDFYPDTAALLIGDDEIRRALPARLRNIHKGNCGHLLIVAGSVGMAGAAALCAQAALRSGVGLLTIACPQSIVPVIQSLAPCAICVPLAEKDGAISNEAFSALKDALTGKNAVVCGCGLSRRTGAEILRLLLTCPLPVLFDADALNLIASDNALKSQLSCRHLITPHPGEAARLLGKPITSPIDDAFALQQLGAQVLLKGAASIIPEGDHAIISASGCCGMARGGSGDILAGIIGALMAEPSRRSLAMNAAVGSEIHGMAGELAMQRYGVRGMCAQDIIQALPEVYMRYE